MDNICPKSDIERTLKPLFHEMSFLLTIENFSDWPQKTGQFVESQVFCDGDNKWNLRLYPNGDNEENSEFVSLFLHLNQSKDNEISVYYTLAIRDDNQCLFNRKGNKYYHLIV